MDIIIKLKIENFEKCPCCGEFLDDYATAINNTIHCIKCNTDIEVITTDLKECKK